MNQNTYMSIIQNLTDKALWELKNVNTQGIPSEPYDNFFKIPKDTDYTTIL